MELKPYMRDIMDALSHAQSAPCIVFMNAAQGGAKETKQCYPGGRGLSCCKHEKNERTF